MNHSSVITSILYDDSHWLKFEINFAFGKIIAKISNTQECCEEYGIYSMCNNTNMITSLQSYVGKELVNVDILTCVCDDDYYITPFPAPNDEEIIHYDLCYKKILNDEDKTISFESISRLYSKVIIRLSFMNDEHPLDVVLYNKHNGYYSHDIYLDLNLNMNGYSLKHQELTSI
jgi:hypothetical protein